MGINRALLLVVLSVVLLVFVLTTPVLSGRAADDFVVYWSATRLLVSQRNPYDPVALQALQDATFPDREKVTGLAFASWNPPWLLLALLPLGLLPFDIAVRLMFLLNLLLIAGAAVATWRWLRPGDTGAGGMLALVAAVFFAGSLMTLSIGQISTLMLVSLVGGVWLLVQRRDVSAGALLLLALIKPHTVYFLFAVLGIWVLRERRWRVVLGGAGALLLSSALCTLFYRDWWAGYWSLIGAHAFEQYSTATIGGVIHAVTGMTVGRYAGVLLIPLIPLWLKIIDREGWLTGMNAALLLSIPLAPYGFGFDQVVLVPAVVQILAWLARLQGSGRRMYLLRCGLIAVYAGVFWTLVQPGLPYHFLTWIPLAPGGLYGAAWYECRHRASGNIGGMARTM